MESITPSHSHPISGDFLIDYRDPLTPFLMLESKPQVALVCKSFRMLNHLAMEAMWKHEMTRKEKRVNNRLKERMLAITAKTALETDVTACYRKL
jgi:hypothetical protein